MVLPGVRRSDFTIGVSPTLTVVNGLPETYLGSLVPKEVGVVIGVLGSSESDPSNPGPSPYLSLVGPHP